ncbi:MAG: regulatory protein [Methylococcaceae bacterium NSP1-2]|nr:recombination regulator RecX [Methylococcaceae bacterium]OYV15405.1 MAG: regulatory protein [Methylococcaceae bacterium NSP1-2]
MPMIDTSTNDKSRDAEVRVSKQIKDSCLRLLMRREHSQKELLTKLVAKGFNKNDILPVIEELANQGWQSDTRYAESYTRHRIQKGYGSLAISYELKQNGVNAVNLDNIMLAFADSWLELLEQVYHKKYDHNTRLSRSEWAKRCRFLMQRGFPSTLITALCQHLNIQFS